MYKCSDFSVMGRIKFGGMEYSKFCYETLDGAGV